MHLPHCVLYLGGKEVKAHLKAHDQSISVKQVEPVHMQCIGLISVILNKGA